MQYDKEFLLKLDKNKNRITYARITALQFNESPVEYIEGRVTTGSINIDGSSAIRRTCSLTIVAEDFNYNDYYWGLNTKFKLEIGLQNTVDASYPDIIWFPQGIYLITSFNTSRSTNNFTISISGKDKMCLLNGEVSGNLEASVDFGTIEEETADGVWSIRKIPIQEIIKNLVHTYAGEPYWNIIINDLEAYGLELLEYRYDTPMYLYRKPNSTIYDNVIMENSTSTFYIQKENSQGIIEYEEKTLPELDYNYLDLLVDSLTGVENPRYVYDYNDSTGEYIPYIFAKIEYGQTAGYRTTDLTYAGDLVAKIGESITSILDKIKNMLVEFEYFYDLDGQFVFQKKKSFTNTLLSSLSSENRVTAEMAESLMHSNTTSYTFNGGELISSFNNNPNLLNMRNDYSVWGTKKTPEGAEVPIHLRYAIDKKPIKYVPITVEDDDPQLIAYNQKYGTSMKGQTPGEKGKPLFYDTSTFDWREIIYQMASDYYKYNFLEDFELRLLRANYENYPTGQTGYEHYYIDIQGFWRQLYDPDLKTKLTKLIEEKEIISNTSSGIGESSKKYWEDLIKQLEADISKMYELIKNDTITEAQYTIYMQKQNELVNARNRLGVLENRLTELEKQIKDYEKNIVNYYFYNYNKDGEEIGEYTGDKRYWNRNVFEAPETLNFWFDFLETANELQQFSVKTVGFRSKSVNDSNVKSIYFRETPNIIFTTNITENQCLSGYKYIQIPSANIEKMFSISSQGKSAKDKLSELIYEHGYCVESATINAIPIYYLEPNSRIHLYDNETGLNGDYIVSKISLPLQYNGTMSITATKAAEALFQ